MDEKKADLEKRQAALRERQARHLMEFDALQKAQKELDKELGSVREELHEIDLTVLRACGFGILTFTRHNKYTCSDDKPVNDMEDGNDPPCPRCFILSTLGERGAVHPDRQRLLLVWDREERA
jgi:hypothetical protein